MVSWQIENALLCNQQLTYPVVLPFQEQARETVWNDHVKRLLNEFTSKGLPFQKNETTLSIEFAGRGRFKLLGSNNDVALRSASNWGAFAGDEFDDWQPGLWESVIRPNLMTHKAKAMIGGTPKGKRNIWQLSRLGNFKEFHFSSYDNPDLDRAELDELVADAKQKGEDYYLQEIMAEYIKPYGVVYKEWNENTHFKHIGYDSSLPIHITIDFGVNDPTAIIWIQPNSGEFRVIDYAEFSDGNADTIAQIIHSKPYKSPELVTGDDAGRARTITTGTSIIDELQKRGIYVRTTSGLKIPDQIRKTKEHIKSLYVDSSLERFRDCLLNYRYPELKGTERNQSNEIPIHDEFSHAMRALEYYFCNKTEQSAYTPTYVPNKWRI